MTVKTSCTSFSASGQLQKKQISNGGIEIAADIVFETIKALTFEDLETMYYTLHEARYSLPVVLYVLALQVL